jgi:hypothetical protein
VVDFVLRFDRVSNRAELSMKECRVSIERQVSAMKTSSPKYKDAAPS